MKIKETFYSQVDTLKVTEIPLDWWLERFRNWRKIELIETDWTQLPDAPVDVDAYATYRQALRDLPSAKDFSNAELPVRP